MGLILVTNKATGLQECVETKTLRRIVTDREQSGSIIYTKSYLPNRGRIFVDEDLSTIFNQQDTVLYDCDMVLVTLRSNSEQIILFTSNFDDIGVTSILDSNGITLGSKIIQKDSMPDFEVEEPISVIYAYQKVGGVNLNFLFVTRKSDNKELIVMSNMIKYIAQDQVTNDSIINFLINDTNLVVNEALTNIFASQSA